MLATRRSVAPIMLGIVGSALMLFHLLAVGPQTAVVSADEKVSIDAPVDGASVTGRIDIRVTVTMTDSSEIDFYRIYVGQGRSPAAMRPLGPPHSEPAVGEIMATLDTTLLLAGESTIQLRVFPKIGEPIDSSVVINVLAGPTPTRTFSGPVITVPPVAVAPSQPRPGNSAPGVEYPVEALPDVEIPQFAPVERTPIPIQRLAPDPIYDALPTDPIQDDPMLRDIELRPHAPPPPVLMPIPR